MSSHWENRLRALLLIFNFLVAVSGVAASPATVRLTSAKVIEIKPGKIVTASFMVRNDTDRDEEFAEEISLPPGWQKIAPGNIPFLLPAKTEQVRVLAIMPSATAPSKRFEIAYRLRKRGHSGVADATTFTVQVLPVARLDFIVQNKPELVIAGDEYSVKLRLHNRGNNMSRCRLSMKNIPDFSATLEPESVDLEPGASQDIQIRIKTDETLNTKTLYILNIEAVADSIIARSPGTVAETIIVEVIPKVSGELDPYIRLPARVRLIGTAENNRGAGFQSEFSGGGNLDESGKRKIDFLFRGPDLQEKSIYGFQDEYRASYFDESFDLHLGDRNYSLSPLTERYGYGRGAELNIRPQSTTALGVFSMESLSDFESFKETGAYIKHDFGPIFSLKANFLDKKGYSSFLSNAVPANVYSVQPQFRFGRYLNLDLEYGFSDSDLATGNDTHAYRAEVRGEPFDGVTYSLERLHADPQFLGFYNDSDATYGTVTFPVYRDLRGNFSINQYDNNLKLDSAKSPIANREIMYRPGLIYSFPFGTDVSVDYQNITRKDLLLPADYDLRENSVRVGLGHSFGKTSLQTFVEQGIRDDQLSNRSEHVARYSLYAYYRPTPSQTYSAFATIGSSYVATSSERSQTFGVSADWRIGKNLSVNTQYAKNRYDSISGREQDNLYATVNYTFPNHHNLALSGRWTQNSATKEAETSVLLTYTIPLSLPVGKKRNIGVLKGQVFALEGDSRVPLPRVILRANGASAVTDRKGEFIFPSLAPGTYALQIEQNSIGLNRVTMQPLPLTVEIKKGGTATMNIEIVESCQISAKLSIFAVTNRNLTMDKTSSDQDQFQEVSPLQAGLVEITNGKEVLRQVSDQNGQVSFDHLRPGKWALNTYNNNLPAYHYIENQQTEIELRPGQKSETVLRILPRHRPIQFIDSGVLN